MLLKQEHRFLATEEKGEVGALWLRPSRARYLYVLAHGAGAGMAHPFMEALATKLGDRGIATLRYQLPYMEAGKKRPDTPKVVEETVRRAVEFARTLDDQLPLFAGGKSMGGRLTSSAQAKEPLPGVRGLVFVGFPLHPAGKPGVERAEHLPNIHTPMLFLSGTRDALSDLHLLEPICRDLGTRSTLHIVEGADHGFHVLKRSGRTDEDVLEELAEATLSWAESSLELP